MFEMVEKAVLTGLGAVSLTQKLAEELLKELKEKYKMSEEEGKQFVDKLQSLAKDGRTRVVEMAESEVRKAMDKAGLVTREEFDRLKARVEELERKLEGSGS